MDPGADRGPLLGALMRLSHQTLMAEILRASAEAGFPDVLAAHMAAIRPLWDCPEGARATWLAAEARITKQSMAVLLDQLEERGYVTRLEDPSDRRAKLVVLTRRGREVGRVLRAATRRVEADWAKRIGAGRVDAMREALRDLVRSLDLDAANERS